MFISKIITIYWCVFIKESVKSRNRNTQEKVVSLNGDVEKNILSIVYCHDEPYC